MEKLNFTDKNRNIVIAILVGMLTILFAVIASLTLSFDIVQNLVMSWILTVLYGIFALFLVGDFFYIQRTVEVEKPVYIDRPVIQEIIREVEMPIQIPVENQTIKVVEKPVIQRIEVPVIKRIYIERKKKKLNIPKFNYIASSEAKRFHTRFCRLGKLIKKKFKVHNNSQAFFKKKHFKACKVCIKNQKKI